MRLTLRTLLAYRDGVLSPAETSDLHQRIRQTEVASNLLRRVDNLVKHKQLLAPKLNGEGLGGDANSVAEYLDDALASEQVPEFERICIAESDLALAELAHCHQLLAEALNSQVIVPNELRALVVGLSNPRNQTELSRRLKIGIKTSSFAVPAEGIRRVDDPHTATLADTSGVQAKVAASSQLSQVQAPMLTSGGGSIKPQGLDLERPQLAHEVPEYLVGQRQSAGWKTPLAICAMIALLSLIAWQALGPLSNVRDLLVANKTSPNDTGSTGSQKNTPEPGSGEVGKGALKSNVEAAAPVVVSNASPRAPEIALHEPIDLEARVPVVENSKQADAPNMDAPHTGSASPESNIADSGFRWTPNTEDAKSVLFQRPVGGTTLQRVIAKAPLAADSEIIVPPSMRPTLNLAGHCVWSVCGPSLMQVSQDENVTITTSLCRAITKSGAEGHDITIAAPTGSVKLHFEDAASMAAVEVACRPVAHGPITDRLAFKPFLIIVAVEGQIRVTPIREAVESKSISLVVGEGVAFADAQPIEFELGAIPTWYRAGHDRPLDLLAAADLNKAIHDTDDAVVQLTGLCSDSRPETAALAMQCKMLLGDWGGFAGDFLNNESMRSHWSSAIGLAEQLIAAKEQNATALRLAFETAHPGRGEALFALFAGMADGSPAKELLQRLVDSLGSERLDERVLAANQLRRLVGKDLGFQPSIPNRAVLQQWRRTITSSPTFMPLDSPLWEAKKPVADR